MHVSKLTLHDFRSYGTVELDLEPGATAFIGSNGQGKTNLVEAIDYLSRLDSHRVSGDAPLVRAGAEQAIVRADVVKGDRTALLELEITPGRSNRARINRGALPRVRDLVGVLRTVMFSPEDLALVKGDPSDRRRFLDSLLVLRTPRLAGVKADYDRVLKQRNTLLKSARGRRNVEIATLDIWDENLARTGAELVTARLLLLDALAPHLADAYQRVASGSAPDRRDVTAVYKPSVELPEGLRDEAAIEQLLLEEVARRRGDELDRGISLVGPHRDEVVLTIGELPAKGYASHGESWSYALALKLASFELLREDDDDPVLILDDVFAELDQGRRQQLAELVGDAEQVLVTAAVAEDVPEALKGHRFRVAGVRSSVSEPDDGLDLARQIARSYKGKGVPGTPRPKRRVRPAKPSRDKNEDATPLSELLGQVVHNEGWDEKLSEQRVFTDWARIVGPEVAQHAVIEGFDDALLHVRTSSTAWATQLRMLAPRIVAKLNAELGDGTVLRIEVRGPQAPSWKKGPRSIRGARGPRDTYG